MLVVVVVVVVVVVIVIIVVAVLVVVVVVVVVAVVVVVVVVVAVVVVYGSFLTTSDRTGDGRVRMLLFRAGWLGVFFLSSMVFGYESVELSLVLGSRSSKRVTVVIFSVLKV